MCNEDIHRELVAIGQSHPGALIQHSQAVTDQVDTLADLLCETAEDIKADSDAMEGAEDAPPASMHPSAPHWREYQAAVRAMDTRPKDDSGLATAFLEAQDRFIYAEDATLQGIYFKLRFLAQGEELSSYLEENRNLIWPLIILTILRDLKALGSLEEPEGEH